MSEVKHLQELCEDIRTMVTDKQFLFELSLVGMVNPSNYKRAAARMRKKSIALAKLFKAFRKTSVAVAKELPKQKRKKSK